MALDMDAWRGLQSMRPAEKPRLRVSYLDWRETTGWQPVEEVPIEHVTGDVRVLRGFASRHLDHARDVWIYLPPGYDDQPEQRYPVLYMHDGNNLFDPNSAFGGQDWGVNETAEWMIQAGLLPRAIIVGPANSADRLAEYTWTPCPQKGGGRGHGYARFLVDELKPYIDGAYRTLHGREHTAVLGSSLGGLISLYLGHHAGDHFGHVGAMSPSLWWGDRQAMRDLAGIRPDLRIWLDMGTSEGRTPEESARYLEDARAFRGLLEARGYEVGQNLAHWEVEGATHSEGAWGHRAAMALMYLVRQAA